MHLSVIKVVLQVLSVVVQDSLLASAPHMHGAALMEPSVVVHTLTAVQRLLSRAALALQNSPAAHSGPLADKVRAHLQASLLLVSPVLTPQTAVCMPHLLVAAFTLQKLEAPQSGPPTPHWEAAALTLLPPTLAQYPLSVHVCALLLHSS
jgi:hypothetical protein